MSNEMSDREKIANVLSYAIIKKLITPVNRTKAYRLGLVDTQGRSIKEPETQEEIDSLNLFDKVTFKIKRMLGGKISQLNNFLYVQTLDDDFLNNLVVRGGADKRAVVKMVKKDFEKLQEKYGMSSEEMITSLLHDDIRKVDQIKDLGE